MRKQSIKQMRHWMIARVMILPVSLFAQIRFSAENPWLAADGEVLNPPVHRIDVSKQKAGEIPDFKESDWTVAVWNFPAWNPGGKHMPELAFDWYPSESKEVFDNSPRHRSINASIEEGFLGKPETGGPPAKTNRFEKKIKFLAMWTNHGHAWIPKGTMEYACEITYLTPADDALETVTPVEFYQNGKQVSVGELHEADYETVMIPSMKKFWTAQAEIWGPRNYVPTLTMRADWRHWHPQRMLYYHGCTPDVYADTLEMARQHVEQVGGRKFLTVGIWNEIYEDEYIEPDVKYGYEYGKRIKAAFEGK